MPNFLSAHPNVKLIVIDSIAFHFRQDLQVNRECVRVWVWVWVCVRERVWVFGVWIYLCVCQSVGVKISMCVCEYIYVWESVSQYGVGGRDVSRQHRTPLSTLHSPGELPCTTPLSILANIFVLLHSPGEWAFYSFGVSCFASTNNSLPVDRE